MRCGGWRRRHDDGGGDGVGGGARWLGHGGWGTTLRWSGYNASALAIGAQFAFNVPNVVPLPNENLIEEDVPFARTEVGSGPVVDSVGAPYYPGDIAADLGSLLITFGAPALPLNDPLLAESKYPTSPGYTAHATFGIPPAAATALQPSIFSSVADSSANGGDATGTISDLSLDNLSDGINQALSATDAALSATNSALGTTALAEGLAGSLALTKEADGQPDRRRQHQRHQQRHSRHRRRVTATSATHDQGHRHRRDDRPSAASLRPPPPRRTAPPGRRRRACGWGR